MEELQCFECKKILQPGDEYMTFFNVDLIKCRSCHEKDPTLRNFQECETYSRIVGYIRPVKQWNPGKKSEWKDRKTYTIGKRAN